MKTKINVAKKYLGVMLLLTGMLLGIKATAMAQVRPAPNRPQDSRFERVKIKANLRVTAEAQGNCVPLTFQVANTGGSNSGVFKITLISQTGEIVQTFSVEDMKAKETRAFNYPQTINGLYTVVVDPDKAVDELFENDNEIKIETRCIR